jgi:anaerobic selenocysteine-containing dehydrogenase
VKSPSRLKFPEYRAPGSDRWERVTWEWALDRIARLMKDDRDKNFLLRNAAGVTVNRWPTVGFLAASASSNETGYITGKVIRALGGVAVNRWQTVGFLAASASSNESGYITGKVIRALGGVAIDNQARV